MNYINDTDPIYLHTDASDFGIGGHLFQLIDGKEVPVAFVSKS
jgi:RNase H-like domain found in reverse transcriptase